MSGGILETDLRASLERKCCRATGVTTRLYPIVTHLRRNHRAKYENKPLNCSRLTYLLNCYKSVLIVSYKYSLLSDEFRKNSSVKLAKYFRMTIEKRNVRGVHRPKPKRLSLQCMPTTNPEYTTMKIEKLEEFRQQQTPMVNVALIRSPFQ